MDRMTDIEERLAHLMRTVDDLNAVVARQDEEIRRLTRQVTLLVEQEARRAAEGEGGAIFADDRPPHY